MQAGAATAGAWAWALHCGVASRLQVSRLRLYRSALWCGAAAVLAVIAAAGCSATAASLQHGVVRVQQQDWPLGVRDAVVADAAQEHFLQNRAVMCSQLQWRGQRGVKGACKRPRLLNSCCVWQAPAHRSAARPPQAGCRAASDRTRQSGSSRPHSPPAAQPPARPPSCTPPCQCACACSGQEEGLGLESSGCTTCEPATQLCLPAAVVQLVKPDTCLDGRRKA